MIKQPESTTFKFVLNNEQIFQNLDHLKLNNYDRFLKIGQIGKQIQNLSKSDEIQQLEDLVNQNMIDLPFMKIQIQDAFVSALNLRNQKIVQFFLKNGMQINNVAPQAVISLCYSLQYLYHDPPIDLLKIILQYGANPKVTQQQKYDSALHLACRYGNLDFIKLLIDFGGDKNAVNIDKMTPLNLAISLGKKNIEQYLKSINASSKWNQ